MISQSDIEGRLRLLRYGLIVVVVVTFLVSLLAPWASFRGLEGLNIPPITDFLGNAILFTIIVAIVAVAVYFVYHYLLTKSWPLIGKKG